MCKLPVEYKHDKTMATCKHYSWVVVVASFWLLGLYSGTLASYGILLPEYVDYFAATKARVTVIQTLTYCAALISGVPVGWLVQKFGWKVLTMAGSFSSFAGFLLSAFVDDLNLIYMTHGFLPGVGLVAYLVCASVAVTRAFDKRRTLALGISMTGLGFGLFIWAPFIRYLLNIYGRRGAMLIFSAVHLHGNVAACLFRQPSKQIFTSTVSQTQAKSNPTDSKLYLCMLKSYNFCFRDIKLFLYIIGYTLTMTGHIIPYLLIPARAESLGISKTNSALLLSLLGVSNIVARPACGYLGDRFARQRTLLFSLTSIVCAVLTCFVYFFTTFASLISYLVLHGLLAGGYVSTFTAVVADLVSTNHLAVANGVMAASCQGTTAIVMPISGLLVDTTSDYSIPFMVFGAVQAFGGVLSFIVYRLQISDKKRPIFYEETIP